MRNKLIQDGNFFPQLSDCHIFNNYQHSQGNENFCKAGKKKPHLSPDILDVSSTKQEYYLKILTEKFPRGYSIDSSIDLKRFRIFYRDMFETECNDADESVKKMMTNLGIDYGSGRVMSPKNAIDDETLKALLDYVHQFFLNGKNALYYKALFFQFQDSLRETNVYNDVVLKKVLIHFIGSQYHFRRSFFTNDENFHGNPAMEIEELLSEQGSSMPLAELALALPHIPQNLIQSVCKKSDNIFALKADVFAHISSVEFDEEFLDGVRQFINEELEQDGYLSVHQLILKLQDRQKSFFENNTALSETGLKNALAKKLATEYSFGDIVIGKKSDELTLPKLLVMVFGDRTRIFREELVDFLEEFEARNLLGLYAPALLENFIHADEETFIKKGSLDFDVQETDVVIDKFCAGEYLPLSDITSFSLFPSMEVSWNIFLLESYIRDYSKKYRLMHDASSTYRRLSRPVGAIVKRDSSWREYDKILSDVVAKAPELNLDDKNSIICFLYEQGYLSKRQLKQVDAIITSAKIIKKQNGRI